MILSFWCFASPFPVSYSVPSSLLSGCCCFRNSVVSAAVIWITPTLL